MIKNFSKKYIIKIPKDISVLYNNEKKIITFIGSLGRKSLQLKIKINILKTEKFIQISNIPFFKLSGNKKKTIKALQGTTVALIKQSILEISVSLYKKLNLVGVGYRVFFIEILNHQLLNFKLGYSHHIYFKIPNDLTIHCLKATNLYIFGHSYKQINQTAALIRSYKQPEPYKGKGILYENEKINIKEGKKI